MQRLRVLVSFVALCALAHAAHLRWRADDDDTSSARETLADPASLRWTSLTYRSLVSDYYWIRALEHFGDIRNNDSKYPLAEPLVTRSLTLDPYFKSAYVFAGTALTLDIATVPRSIELLRAGEAMRPDVWKIPFYLGFNLFYFEHDYGDASEALARAAQLPGAPDYTASLATRIAAHAGRASAALKLVDQLIANSTDERTRESYVERRYALVYEVQLERLTAMTDEYTKDNGHPPSRIEDVVSPVPEDPWGKRYELGSDGKPTSASIDKRLRVYGADP